MILNRVFVATGLLLLSVQGVALAASDAHEWLQRMSMASRSLNYSGTFVYQHSGHLEAMQVLHAMDENGERERLMSLTGPRREVLRDNREVTCILGDRQSVVVNKSRPRQPFPGSFPSALSELEQYYSFEVKGKDRVAGLPCQIVQVRPRDDFRYGHRLCVHDKSHLLLRSELTDSANRVIEQVMFTSLDFPEHISDRDLLPELDGADFSWQRQPEEQPHSTGNVSESTWNIDRVPEGFMLTDRNWHNLSGDIPVEHWVYSDGLASVSVYIEKSGKENDTYNGVSHRGALNAFGTMMSGYYVTLVGEVPLQTLEMMGKSISVRSDD